MTRGLCDKTLDKDVMESGLPVYGEIPMCSDIRVCKWRAMTQTYNDRRH